jgi:uncharacterized glyoxalase superfamily protein PhnB
MNAAYKPRGTTTVSPYLIVDGASDTIDFLTRVFGAVELGRFPDSTGKLMHAEVRIEDSVVMIADGVEGWPPVPWRRARRRCRSRWIATRVEG